MNQYQGQTLSWELKAGVIEVALRRTPCNEIGSQTLEDLESMAAALPTLEESAHALIIYSALDCGFCAGADLRELYRRSQQMEKSAAATGVRDFLQRIHHVMNSLDASPLT